ncbi:hypothetical protein BD413DRAFT_468079 [Trametes elegans]|nr:hypothetical protein BD413DRAFT_468079 [Trametes elegans]
MSSLVDKIKNKTSSNSNSNSNSNSQPSQPEEQSFSIQPHPAKSNDPRDLQPSLGGGLNTKPEVGAFHARDPYVPPKNITDNLPPAQSRDELRARAAELNKQ